MAPCSGILPTLVIAVMDNKGSATPTILAGTAKEFSVLKESSVSKDSIYETYKVRGVNPFLGYNAIQLFLLTKDYYSQLLKTNYYAI